MCNLGDREMLYLVIPAIIYFVTFIFGMMGSISVSLARDDNNGNCPLYASRSGFSESPCNYVIAMHVMFCILLAVALIGLVVFAVYRRLRAQPLGFLSTLPVLIGALILHAIVCFLVFVAACVISAGMDKTCDTYGSCRGVPKKIRRKIETGEAASWLAWLCWLLLVALFAFRVWQTWRYGTVVTTASSSTTATSVTTTTVTVQRSSSFPAEPQY